MKNHKSGIRIMGERVLVFVYMCTCAYASGSGDWDVGKDGLSRMIETTGRRVRR